MSEGTIPTELRKCRACIGCGLIQTTDWWKDNVCPNCQFDDFNMRDYTSASFSGIVSLFQPEKSWCASWQRYNSNYVGLYALYNDGEVTKKIIDQFKKHKRPAPEWVEKAAHEFNQ